MKWGGASYETAMKFITQNPALQLGVADRVGTIEVGKDADLAVFEGDPLSMDSRVRQTYVDGLLYFDSELDRERRAAIEREKQALLEKHGGQRRTMPVTEENDATIAPTAAAASTSTSTSTSIGGGF